MNIHKILIIISDTFSIIYKINLYNINKVIVEAITEVTIVIISFLVCSLIIIFLLKTK